MLSFPWVLLGVAQHLGARGNWSIYEHDVDEKSGVFA